MTMDPCLEEAQRQKDKIKRAPFETALHHAGNGRFQWHLLCVCGAVYAACALSTTTLSFVLPVAQCDFNLESKDKGQLIATPLIGMCVGSYFWGNLADARGRKKAIIGALILDALAAFLSSLAQTFPLFLACRFFSGFGIIGATGLVFPYFGDFLTLRHRDVMLTRLEVFWTLGTILLPGIAWLIIPQKIFNFAESPSAFQYQSWRTFVAACGIPSVLVALLVLPFPESPRFLLHARNPESALAVLRTIFAVNHKLPVEDFPVESMKALDEDEDPEVAEDAGSTVTKPPMTWHERVQAFWARKKLLTAPPYIGYLVLCCFVDFGLMFSYYTLMMWFPDLFERFSQFTAIQPDASADVCEVANFLSIEEENLTKNCTKQIHDTVYVHTLLVALSCLPTSITVGLVINKVGKKILLVLMLITSGLCALGLSLVHSSVQNLVLSCAFEAIISCTEAVLFCVICEIFPTNVAATAMAVTVMCGRVGAIVGNVIFGALVDQYCVVPIYMFGAFLISSGLLCIVLPKTSRPERHP